MSKKSKRYGEAADNKLIAEPWAVYTIYSWKYSDRTYAGAVYCHETSKFIDVKYGSKTQWERWRKKAKKDWMLSDQKMLHLSDFIKEPAAWNEPMLIMQSLKSQAKTESEGKRYVRALKQYLLGGQAVGETKIVQDMRPRLLLMANLLSGAIIPVVSKCDEISRPQERMAAPIVQVGAAKGDIGDFMLKTAKSFCVKTMEDKPPLSFENPPYFPYGGNKASEIDNAYIEADGEGKQKQRLFTLYCHCSVVINARILGMGNARNFIYRNPLCSTVVLGNGNLKIDGVLSLPADELSPAEQDWNAADLQEMSQEFTWWLFRRYKGKHDWAAGLVKEAGRLLDTYEEKHTKIKPADRYHWVIRLITLMALSEFLTDTDGWSESSGLYWRAVWLNALFPDCCKISDEDVPPEERDVITEAEYPEIFRRAMCEMLKDANHLPYIPRINKKELCPECPEDDPAFRYYGYRRWFAGDKVEGHCAAVFFIRNEFLEQLKQYMPDKCDPKKILKHCEETIPAYFAPQKKVAKKARIPRTPDDNKSVSSVILMLDELDFLPDDLREQLMEPFKQEKNDGKRPASAGLFFCIKCSGFGCVPMFRCSSLQ